jgi:hypothetical protein
MRNSLFADSDILNGTRALCFHEGRRYYVTVGSPNPEQSPGSVYNRVGGASYEEAIGRKIIRCRIWCMYDSHEGYAVRRPVETPIRGDHRLPFAPIPA